MVVDITPVANYIEVLWFFIGSALLAAFLMGAGAIMSLVSAPAAILNSLFPAAI